MFELRVIVGVIGSGKTTAASDSGFARISFDEEWHARWQRHGGTRDDFVDSVIATVNQTHSDVAVDGWWTWVPTWFEADPQEDKSFARLQTGLTQHRVTLTYLQLDASEAVRRYMAKYSVERMYRMAVLHDPEAYCATISRRIAYLESKIKETGLWVM